MSTGIFGLNPAELLNFKRNQGYVKSSFDGELSLSIEDVNESKRIVRGLYNAYYYSDSYNDVLVQGAASKSIGERGVGSNSGRQIVHALQHNMKDLPGKIILLEDTPEGILFETKMLENDRLGDETWDRYVAGMYNQHSIGFHYIWDKLSLVEEGDDEFKRMLQIAKNPQEILDNGYFYLVKEIYLAEGSTVTTPANQWSSVLELRSDEQIENFRSEKQALIQGIIELANSKNANPYLIKLQAEQLKTMEEQEKMLLKTEKPLKKDTSDDLSRKNKALNQNVENNNGLIAVW